MKLNLRPTNLNCACNNEKIFNQRIDHTAGYMRRLFNHILEMHSLCQNAGVLVMVKLVVYFLQKMELDDDVKRTDVAEEFLMLLEMEIGNITND